MIRLKTPKVREQIFIKIVNIHVLSKMVISNFIIFRSVLYLQVVLLLLIIQHQLSMFPFDPCSLYLMLIYLVVLT